MVLVTFAIGVLIGAGAAGLACTIREATRRTYWFRVTRPGVEYLAGPYARRADAERATARADGWTFGPVLSRSQIDPVLTPV